MKTKKILKAQLRFFYLALLFLFFFIVRFQFNDLASKHLMKKSAFLRKPPVRSAKIEYYKKKLDLASKAISYMPDNADLYSHKAGFMRQAYNDGISDRLGLEQEEIEKLYLKALSLDPANFMLHFDLGTFYIETNNEKSFDQLTYAANACPTWYLSHLYLAKYNLVKGNEWRGFLNLVEGSYCSKSTEIINNFAKNNIGIKTIDKLSQISFDWEKLQASYVVNPVGYEFNFKKENMPAIRQPLIFKVYMDQEDTTVCLYYENKMFKHFTIKEPQQGYFVQQLILDEFPKDSDLSDFLIRTEDFSDLGKIEIVINY